MAGYSKSEFSYKMSISSKEAHESLYWLELLEKSQLVAMNYSEYISNCKEIIKILTSIVKTAQNKRTVSQQKESNTKLSHENELTTHNSTFNT